MKSGTLGLLERDREQAELDRLFDGAVSGAGGFVVFEGPAGIGKTRLLAAAFDGAQRRGMAVGRARGGSLEQDFAFGVVRQLLEPLIATGDQGWWLEGAAAAAAPVLRTTGEVDPAAAGSVLHGLYWVTAALAERRPLALILDDAHWFDGPSLRYLAYLAHRVEELPIALVVATRSPESGPEGELLARVLAEHRMHSLHPAPLSASAVAVIVRDVLDAEADTKFCDAVAEATRGNPFLVEELMRSVTSVGLATDASSAGRVGEVAAGSAVLGRLGRLSSGARELASAVAVLGGDAHLRHAAALAGVDIGAAELAADSLLRAEILGPERPLTFVHPLVASAVYRDLLPGERSLLHRRAARLLSDERESVSRIAAHLLATEPSGDPGVVEVLRDAARAAGAQGATDVAISYLRRALKEPPPVADRLGVMFELGANEAFVSDLGAVEHLGEVLPTIGDPDTRLLLGIGRAMALAVEGYAKEALAAVAEIAENPAGDPIPSLDMLAATVLVAMTGPTAAALATAEIDDLLRVEFTDDTPAIVHGVRSFVGAFANENTDAMADIAAHSLAIGPPDGAMLPVWYHLPITTLLMADRVADASAAVETALIAGRRLGAPAHIGVSTFLRAWLALRQGELADAEADALASVEIHQLYGNDFLVPAPLAVLINVLLERDDLAGADALLNRFGYSAGDGDSLFHLFLLRARGRLRGAQRRFDDWIADATRGLDRYAANAGVSPGFLAFDADLARAYAATGAMASATKHAQRALELALACGAPRALGEGLGAVALVDQHAPLDTGDQAIEAFQRAGATLETAWMMHDLAVSDRRRGSPEAATLLADSLALAERCGADRLAGMARHSLAAIGSRPRRRAVIGADALTPSERRVTTLASVGRTNKNIAQELYVTVKTVETHLARAYQKLQITSRAELASALSN